MTPLQSGSLDKTDSTPDGCGATEILKPQLGVESTTLGKLKLDVHPPYDQSFIPQYAACGNECLCPT